MGKFVVQWSNDTSDFKRPMSSHTVNLRQGHTTRHGHQGLDCEELYLDQVYIMFRPTNEIGANEYKAPDADTFDWHTETDQLLVRTNPGFQYPLYAVQGNTTSDHITSAHNPTLGLTFSQSLTVKDPGAKNVDDTYWCRTYRPVRDLPIATHVHNVGTLQIDLLFPVLLDAVSSMQSVPDYRILRVICEFTTKEV